MGKTRERNVFTAHAHRLKNAFYLSLNAQLSTLNNSNYSELHSLRTNNSCVTNEEGEKTPLLAKHKLQQNRQNCLEFCKEKSLTFFPQTHSHPFFSRWNEISIRILYGTWNGWQTYVFQGEIGCYHRTFTLLETFSKSKMFLLSWKA